MQIDILPKTTCQTNFKCSRCGATFVRLDSFQCHMKQHSKPVLKPVSEPVSTSFPSTISSVSFPKSSIPSVTKELPHEILVGQSPLKNNSNELEAQPQLIINNGQVAYVISNNVQQNPSNQILTLNPPGNTFLCIVSSKKKTISIFLLKNRKKTCFL